MHLLNLIDLTGAVFFLTSSMRHPREIDLFTNLNENAIFPQPLV